MKKLLLFSMLMLALFSCRKDVNNVSVEEITESPNEVIINYDPEVNEVTATVVGFVTDENGSPVANANVELGSQTTSTNDRGRFIFKDQIMNSKGTFVQVFKDAYFNGSKRFFPKDESDNYINITLLDRTSIGTFPSNQGGLISSSEGIQLEFPANSIVNSSGETYNGTVEVSARWINPEADNLYSIMPGNLQGVNSAGEEVALASYGMMAVELEGENGEALNLGNGLKATLTFPLSTDMAANAPAEIPLWSFNEDYGIWVEEGSATLQNGTYIGDVSHFSFWNCDFPYPLIELSGTAQNEDGSPFANGYVMVKFQDGNIIYSAGAQTDANGYFSGKVPMNEELTLIVYDQYDPYNGCGILLSMDIGPFADDTDIGIVVVNDPDVLNISGVFTDCDSEALTNGWIDIEIGTRNYSFYIGDGNDFDVAIYNCEDATDLNVTVVNLENLEQSDVTNYTISDPLDLGTISACGSTATEYLTITIDGITTNFVDVGIGFYGPDSSFISAYHPGQSTHVNLELDEITSPGVYSGDVVNGLWMNLPTSNGPVSIQCWDPQPNNCGVEELIITELGEVGENVIGSFTGTSDFIDSNQQTVTLSYSATFEIIRD